LRQNRRIFSLDNAPISAYNKAIKNKEANEMNGSEKQIKWATKIQHDLIVKIENLKPLYEQQVEPEYWPEVLAMMNHIIDEINEIDNAAALIGIETKVGEDEYINQKLIETGLFE
jgi:hypothetical protein